MNWTEGTLYRHSRGRLRKTNPARQRQKEYFARARLRFAQQRGEIVENGPPVSLLRPPRSSPAPSQYPHISRKSRSSSVARTPQREAHRQADVSKKRSRVPSVSIEPRPPPSISRFFEEVSARHGGTGSATQFQYNEEALECMKQRVLARDWGIGKYFKLAPVSKRPRLSPRSPTGDIPDTRNDNTLHRDPAPGRPDGRGVPRIRKLQRDDVRIQVGSQEKRLWQTSTANTATLDRSTAASDRFSSGPSVENSMSCHIP